jgi:hypothetical protein
MKKSEAREGDESQRTRGTAMPHEKFNHGPPGERERIYQATSLIALASDRISSQTKFRVFQQNRPLAVFGRSASFEARDWLLSVELDWRMTAVAETGR